MAADRGHRPPSPWGEFLKELDGLLRDLVHVHFIITEFRGAVCQRARLADDDLVSLQQPRYLDGGRFAAARRSLDLVSP